MITKYTDRKAELATLNDELQNRRTKLQNATKSNKAFVQKQITQILNDIRRNQEQIGEIL